MATSPTSLQMIVVPKSSQPTELINGDGVFNESGFEEFIRGTAASILVIAIIGPQSSGKSTLMNHLFRTNFGVMNANNGRKKTTNGIWIAKAPHKEEPLTVVLDLEGTDGKEKGQDDTAFEKQSALFAITIAHTVIVNMWCNEYGRENAANRPLLNTVFEAMLSLSLFSPQKTTLHFVMRDGNSESVTPSEVLKRDLKKDIKKIWEDVPKPPGNEGTLLSEIFNVEVTVLSNYEYRRDEFDKEVAQLQKQLISHNLDLSKSKIPLSSAKKYWDNIEKHKGFKVPPYRLMVATTRCDEIAMDKLRLFESDKAWLELEENAKTQLVKDFGAQTNSILTTYLSEYDKETMTFESTTEGGYDQQVHEVRSSKRHDLTVKALKVVYPAYKNTLGHIRSETLRSYTTQLKARIENFCLSAFESFQTCYDSCVLRFDEQCSESATIEHAQWEGDASAVREQLLHEIREHALYQLRDELSISVTTEVLNVVKDGSVKDKWDCIRSFIETENEEAKVAAVGIFGAENEKIDGIVTDLEKHARDRVVTSFKKQSLEVEKLLEERFVLALVPMDGNTMPTKEEAYRQCLDMLSTMAVIRLDDTYDVVQTVLRSELLTDENSGNGISLSSRTWENVPPQMTLITPSDCKVIWTKLKKYMEDHCAIADKKTQDIEDYWARNEKLQQDIEDHQANVEKLQQDIEDHQANVEKLQQNIEDHQANAEKREQQHRAIVEKLQQDKKHKEQFVQQHQPSGTGKPSLGEWARSLRKWAIFALSVLGVAGLCALLVCYPALGYKLALAVALVRGIVTRSQSGRYKHSVTKEDIQVDDIPTKHPELMEFLKLNLNTAEKILKTVVA